MNKILFISLFFVSSCAQEYYDYHGERIIIHTKINSSNSKVIKAINLASKGLTSIPEEVKKMHKLVFINLRDNSLHSINELYSLTNLRILLLDRNPIGSISSIDQLPDLEVLSVVSCGLSTVPETIFSLKNLRILVIGGNRIPDKFISELRERLPNCKIIIDVD